MRSERKRSFGWTILAAAMLWAAIALMLVGAAHAQVGYYVFSERELGQPHGYVVRGWNTSAFAIDAGTLVMADTSATGSVPQVAIGKGFKTWSGSTADYPKIIGILMEPAPAGRQWARIMVKGFLPNAKVMSGISAGSYLRPSLTAAGRLAAWTANDSTNQYRRKFCGVFQRYADTDTSIAYVWVDFPAR